MVVVEVEMEPPGRVVSESSSHVGDRSFQYVVQSKNSTSSVSPLGRESSIYSLTLDEYQRTLSGGGTNFGSMNMDEFLASIWTAEENQHNQGSTMCSGGKINSSMGNSSYSGGVVGADVSKGLLRQKSLTRQGSLTLPSPLCGKTVDEVWSEIHRNGRSELGGNALNRSNPSCGSNGSNSRHPTFGEMTLEDFLIKAGVVREQESDIALESDYQQQPLNQKSQLALSVAPIAFNGDGIGSTLGQSGVYGGRLGHCSSAMYEGVTEGSATHFGRRRYLDSPTEKVVERKQRRMIKNRESAARSRARKQAYTVELEAELNQLKEENKQLKQAVVELERKRRLQCMEDIRLKTPSKAEKTAERLISMRRNMSCPL